MSVAIENAGIDYHVVLAQNALQLCLDNWELQAELLCALVKQTSKHASHKHGVQVFSKLRHRVSSPSHRFFLELKKTVLRLLKFEYFNWTICWEYIFILHF